MFRNLINPDNPLMITMSHVTDCIFLSLFYLLGCFPVVTMGASSAALYDAVYRGFRKKDKHSWQRFAASFRRNFKMSFFALIPYLAVLLGGGYGMIQVWNAFAVGKISDALFAGAALLAMLLLGVISVLFPLLSRFETSVGQLLKNTVLLALANMPRTLCLGVLNGVSIFVCVRFIVPLFFLPALAAFLSSYLLEPMFKPYMPKEEETAAE